jgi:hypothetical protein
LELSAVIEFENQDRVKNIVQANQTNLKQKWHMDSNAAFPFQYDFSVGTIHGKNMVPQSKDQGKDTVSKDTAEVIEINDNWDDISILFRLWSSQYISPFT